MAIIIEHMEMPNGCCECRMQAENCCTLSLRPIDNIYDRPEWCLLTEAEPVKHGRWVKLFETENDITARCSECGMVYTLGKGRDPNYCGTCGAKMDEVKK